MFLATHSIRNICSTLTKVCHNKPRVCNRIYCTPLFMYFQIVDYRLNFQTSFMARTLAPLHTDRFSKLSILFGITLSLIHLHIQRTIIKGCSLPIKYCDELSFQSDKNGYAIFGAGFQLSGHLLKSASE